MTLLWAYLDPDSGSMLLQMLVGGLASAGVMVRYQWRVIRAFLFAGKWGREAAPGIQAPETDGQQS